MPYPPSWRCWSRRPRTAGSGASTGCAPRPGCRRARPGRPPPSRGQAIRARPGALGARTATGPTGRRRLRGSGRQRAGLRAARHRQGSRPVRRRPPAGGVGTLGAVRPGLPAGAGPPGRQAGPGIAQASEEAGQLRFPARRRPGLPAPGGRGAGELFTLNAERYERRSLDITPPTRSSPGGSTSSPTPWPRRRPSTGWCITR